MSEFAAFAQKLAKVAGEAILPHFRMPLAIENKGEKFGYDPVTLADKAAEAAMRALITKTYPYHGVIGEEYAPTNPNADYQWILDPIDGTKGFITGLPTWGTLIGLTFKGKPVYGLMHQPFVQESFYGDGETAFMSSFLGEKPLKTRACESLQQAVLSATSPHNFDAQGKATFQTIEEKCKFTRFGGDCYAYALLAAGQLDLVIEQGLAPYDIVPLLPLLKASGAIVTTWEGGSPLQGGAIIAAGDRRVYDEAMSLFINSHPQPNG